MISKSRSKCALFFGVYRDLSFGKERDLYGNNNKNL